jgi:hypothetical protein
MENNSMQRNNTDENAFDPNSGISEEEQRQIIFEINNIAEKNRRSLSTGSAAQ